MAQRMIVVKLNRLTLVRKGKGSTAKHPDMRHGVVETVKATETPIPEESPNLRRWRTSWQ